MSILIPILIYQVQDPVGLDNLSSAIDDDDVLIPHAIIETKSSSLDYPFNWSAPFRINHCIPGVAADIPWLPFLESLDDTSKVIRHEFDLISLEPFEQIIGHVPIDRFMMPVCGEPQKLQFSKLVKVYEELRRRVDKGEITLAEAEAMIPHLKVRYPRGFKIQPVSWNPDWSCEFGQMIGLPE